MKNVLYVFIVFSIFTNCGKPEAETFLYKGNWEGTYKGSDSGTWKMTIDNNGKCSGQISSNNYNLDNYVGVGTCDSVGKVSFIYNNLTASPIIGFEGQIVSNSMSGQFTITDNLGNGIDNGIFEGNKK